MTDAREALMALIRREYDKRPVDRYPTEGALADVILTEFDVTPRWEGCEHESCDRLAVDKFSPCRKPSAATTLPSVEDVDFTEVANRAQEALGWGVFPATARAVFEAVLALFPGRTEAEVRAEGRAEGMAEGWAEGYLCSTLDAASGLEPADNPHDPSGLVRHHRGNAVTAVERERDEALAKNAMYRSVLREHGVDPDALDAALAREEGS